MNLWKLFLVLLLAVCLMGCCRKNVKNPEPATEPETTAATEETTPEPTTEVDDFDIPGEGGGVLDDSTEDSFATEYETENATDPAGEQETTKPTEEPRVETETTTDGDTEFNDGIQGDILPPPAENSGGVL